jgi:hypothetical protein
MSWPVICFRLVFALIFFLSLAWNVLVASEGEIKQRFSQLEAWLDERARRLWAAAESAAHGRGGISLVARASGVSRRAIAVGLAELRRSRTAHSGGICRFDKRAAAGRRRCSKIRISCSIWKAPGTGDAGGPAVPAAVDMQKRAESRRGTARPRTRGEPNAGCGTVARTEVQPAGEP